MDQAGTEMYACSILFKHFGVAARPGIGLQLLSLHTFCVLSRVPLAWRKSYDENSACGGGEANCLHTFGCLDRV